MASTLIHRKTRRPEEELLLACARVHLNDVRSEKMRACITRGVDWAWFSEQAIRHKVFPVTSKNIAAAGLSNGNREVVSTLYEDCKRNLHRNLYLTKELVHLAEGFRSMRITAIPYKGPVLAFLAYGDVALRAYDDLDFFVPHRDLPRAAVLLQEEGFETDGTRDYGFQPAAQYIFRKDAGRCAIEIHTERTLRYYPRPLEVEGLLSRLVNVSMSGGEVPSFAPEDLLMILGVHGAKHFWERLIWICDLAELCEACAGIDWDLALGRARIAGCERMVLLGLLLSAELVDARVPPEVLGRARKATGLPSLARRISDSLFRQPDATRGVLERVIFRVRTSESLMEGLRYTLRLATLPAEGDGAHGNESRAFSTLDRASRPWRLLRKYGWSSPRRP